MMEARRGSVEVVLDVVLLEHHLLEDFGEGVAAGRRWACVSVTGMGCGYTQ
jgi:hypothetical protein